MSYRQITAENVILKLINTGFLYIGKRLVSMEKKSLYQMIYEDLLDGIKSGKYPEGSRLPSEKELSEAYDVSRITSKHALERLAEEGIAERMPGKGSFVKNNPFFREAEEKPFHQDIPKDRRLIGVILESFDGNFGAKLLSGIERECRKRNLSMILRCSQGNQAEEAKAIDDLLAIGVQGILLMGVHNENYSPKVLELAVSGFPAVLIDRRMKGIPLSFVGTDNHSAAKELTDYLFSEGHRNIAFVSHAAMDTPTVADRFIGFMESNLEHGVITNEQMWLTDLKATMPNISADERQIGADLLKIKKFILKNPEVTAYFVVEYGIAKMLKSALKDVYGGNDIQKTIVCFDEPEHIVGEPEFTSVRQDEVGIGKNAVIMLSETISGNRNTRFYYLPYQIRKKQDEWYKDMI